MKGEGGVWFGVLTTWSDKALILGGLPCEAGSHICDLSHHALPLLFLPLAAVQHFEHLILCHRPHLTMHTTVSGVQ